jgi:hypothetical protein
MPDDETSRLPPGYRLNLVGDPCIIILRGPDGAVVARFSRTADPEEIRRAAQEAHKEGDWRPLFIQVPRETV